MLYFCYPSLFNLFFFLLVLLLFVNFVSSYSYLISSSSLSHSLVPNPNIYSVRIASGIGIDKYERILVLGGDKWPCNDAPSICSLNELWFTDDGGINWSQIFLNNNNYPTSFLIDDLLFDSANTYILAGFEVSATNTNISHIYLSFDNGTTWQPSIAKQPQYAILTGCKHILTSDDRLISVGGWIEGDNSYNSGIVLSTDWRSNYTDWELINPSLPWKFRFLNFLVFDPVYNLIYFGGGENATNDINDLWFSKDFGISWVNIPFAGVNFDNFYAAGFDFGVDSYGNIWLYYGEQPDNSNGNNPQVNLYYSLYNNLTGYAGAVWTKVPYDQALSSTPTSGGLILSYENSDQYPNRLLVTIVCLIDNWSQNGGVHTGSFDNNTVQLIMDAPQLPPPPFIPSHRIWPTNNPIINSPVDKGTSSAVTVVCSISLLAGLLAALTVFFTKLAHLSLKIVHSVSPSHFFPYLSGLISILLTNLQYFSMSSTISNSNGFSNSYRSIRNNLEWSNLQYSLKWLTSQTSSDENTLEKNQNSNDYNSLKQYAANSDTEPQFLIINNIMVILLILVVIHALFGLIRLIIHNKYKEIVSREEKLQTIKNFYIDFMIFLGTACFPGLIHTSSIALLLSNEANNVFWPILSAFILISFMIIPFLLISISFYTNKSFRCEQIINTASAIYGPFKSDSTTKNEPLLNQGLINDSEGSHNENGKEYGSLDNSESSVVENNNNTINSETNYNNNNNNQESDTTSTIKKSDSEEDKRHVGNIALTIRSSQYKLATGGLLYLQSGFIACVLGLLVNYPYVQITFILLSHILLLIWIIKFSPYTESRLNSLQMGIQIFQIVNLCLTYGLVAYTYVNNGLNDVSLVIGISLIIINAIFIITASRKQLVHLFKLVKKKCKKSEDDTDKTENNNNEK